MPELPEVEVISKELDLNLRNNKKKSVIIEDFVLSKFSLRKKIQKKDLLEIKGSKILQIFRRAKYIIFETDKGFLLNHLGMTGSWRFEKNNSEIKKHDHFVLKLSNQSYLIYNDARRFGLIDWAKKLEQFAQLKELGPEPLSDKFQFELFFQDLKGRQQPIKQVLMNPRVVVGVGNIYASEILFRSQVRPTKASNKVKSHEAKKIFEEIRIVLQEAIHHGGSTLKDYRRLEGDEGGFQNRHLVYGRKKLPCVKCQTLIKSEFLGARSTFWCPKCQH